MQIESTLRYNFIPVDGYNLKIENSKCGRECREIEASYTDGGECKICSHFGTAWQILEEVSFELPYNLAI